METIRWVLLQRWLFELTTSGLSWYPSLFWVEEFERLI